MRLIGPGRVAGVGAGSLSRWIFSWEVLHAKELIETLEGEFPDFLTEDSRIYTDDGWLALIREGLVLVRAHGGRVDCIKQRLGFLRIEFFGFDGSKEGWRALFDGLQRISERSKRICEVCGADGGHAEPEQNDSSF